MVSLQCWRYSSNRTPKLKKKLTSPTEEPEAPVAVSNPEETAKQTLAKVVAKAKPKEEKKPQKKAKSESSDSSDSDDSDEKPKPKAAENKLSGVKRTHKAAEKEQEESDDSSDSSESEKQADKPKVADQAAKTTTDSKNKIQKTEEEEKNEESEESEEVNQIDSSVKKDKTVPFSRISQDYAKNLSRELQDNTFEAKAKYGQGGDDFGIHSNQKLKIVKGKDFRKEKTKMKKKNFHGAGNKLVYKVNSIKF